MDSLSNFSQQDVSASRPPVAFRLASIGQTYGGRAGIMIERLEISRGCVTAIMGRSGSGKSTLLNLLGGMIEAENPNEGSRLEAAIRTEDDNIMTHDVLAAGWKGHSDALGFVFQHPFLLRHAPGWENLAMSIAAAGRRSDRAEIERFWTCQLRMSTDKAALRARELSGGMQQRLALGRALIRDPQIILADEPTANLDEEIGNEIIKGICDWQRASRSERTVVIVTHDVSKAAKYAHELIILDPAVIDPTGAQTKPGRLLGKPGLWPRRNPGDPAEISSWMKGDVANLEEIPTRPSDNQALAARPSHTDHDALDTADHDNPDAGSPTRAPGSLSPVSIWTRLGMAAVLSHSQVPADKGRPLRQRVRAAAGSILCIALLATTIALAVFGENEGQQLIGRALTPIVAPFAMLPLFPKMAWSVLLRTVVFTILATIAIAAVEARTVIASFMEAQLNRPDLQPLIVFAGGNSPITPSMIDGLQKKFQASNLVPRALKGEDRSVFGRTSTAAVPMFVPPKATEAATPNCLTNDSVFFVRATTLGVNTAEPFMKNIEWLPIDSPKLVEGAATWLNGTTSQAAPALQDASALPAIYLLEEFVRRNLRIGIGEPMLRWVCIGDAIQGEISKFEPYRIAAIVKSIPLADKRQHDVIASCEVARRFRGGDQRDCDDSNFVYDQAAIRLASGPLRVPHLRSIKELSDSNEIQAESGFQKVQQASTAAAVVAGIGSWFIALTAGLAAFITLFTVLQFIEENRRPLAVSRAFGAKFSAVAIMIGISLLIPCAIAVLMGAAFALFAAPFAVNVARDSFQLGDQFTVDSATSFIKVALCGSVIVGLVYFSVLRVWWNRSKSLANELQEVG
jgi:ABC-type lipoprotein export system ATPase subunit